MDDLTLLAGDFAPGFEDYLEGAGPWRMLVQTNTGDEEAGFIEIERARRTHGSEEHGHR